MAPDVREPEITGVLAPDTSVVHTSPFTLPATQEGAFTAPNLRGPHSPAIELNLPSTTHYTS